VLTFPSEVKIFLNEQQNRWYSPGSYYWAKNLVDLIVGLVITYLFTWSTYVFTNQAQSSDWICGLGFFGADKRFGNCCYLYFECFQRL